MQSIDIERYLHEHIPLSGAMGVRVVSASPQGVRLSAPLAPNINHRATVFGGSASALAILAAWTLLYVRLKAEDISARLVIQRNSMAYEKPMADDFIAEARSPDAAAWEKFIQILQRKGRARIEVVALLECRGEKAGELHGEFVALARL
jgi:thioesterase domain-containing protein